MSFFSLCSWRSLSVKMTAKKALATRPKNALYGDLYAKLTLGRSTLCICVMITREIIGFCTPATLKDRIITRITYFKKE